VSRKGKENWKSSKKVMEGGILSKNKIVDTRVAEGPKKSGKVEEGKRSSNG
jgi:hypothetical protein